MNRPIAFGGARRLVLKIGSAVLSDGGTFDRVAFVSLVRDLIRLREGGLEIVVVSSGAVALGMERLGTTVRPTETAKLQATAAIGQGRGQQRLLAIDALVGSGGDLARQPAQHHIGHLRRSDAGQHAAGGFDPHFAGPVDQQVGDVVARQPRRQRRQIGV